MGGDVGGGEEEGEGVMLVRNNYMGDIFVCNSVRP